MLKVLLFSLGSLLLANIQIPTGGITGSSAGNSATGFAYVASSVTGCAELSGGTSCVAPFHINPGAGHLLVVMTGWGGSTNTATFTSSNNGTWTAIGSPSTGINTLSGFRQQTFVKFSSAAGADTGTLTISGSASVVLWEMAEYSYSGSLVATDGAAYSTTQASGGIGTTATITTGGSSDLLWAACEMVDTTCTTGSGFTGHNDTSACSYNGSTCSSTINFQTATGSIIEEKVNVTAGNYSATFGTGTTDNTGLVIIGF